MIYRYGVGLHKLQKHTQKSEKKNRMSNSNTYRFTRWVYNVENVGMDKTRFVRDRVAVYVRLMFNTLQLTWLPKNHQSTSSGVYSIQSSNGVYLIHARLVNGSACFMLHLILAPAAMLPSRNHRWLSVVNVIFHQNQPFFSRTCQYLRRFSAHIKWTPQLLVLCLLTKEEPWHKKMCVSIDDKQNINESVRLIGASANWVFCCWL